MMDCPKCGFSQPDDQYCAKCGVDMTAYSKGHPKTLSKILNSSQLHLGIIIAVIIATLFYLFISQQDLISKEVGRIFEGVPLLSHSAVDADAEAASAAGGADEGGAASVAGSGADANEDFGASSEMAEPTGANPEQSFVAPSAATGQPEGAPAPPTVDVRYLEISKENMRAIVSTGQVVREFENWRVIHLPSTQSVQNLIRDARPLPGAVRQALPPQGDLEILTGDFDPDPARSFLNFSMIWRMPDTVDWALMSQLRSGETEAAPLVLREHQGKMKWTPKGAVLLVFDPLQRIPISPNAQLEDSPLRVLQSPDFQTGASDLVIWIEVLNMPVMF